jgi:hypothetical protein
VPDLTESLWERVDEPVLRWVASLPPSLNADVYDLELREPEPFDPIRGLDSREVDESLRRLLSHGLIDGRAADAFQTTMWSSLRLTAYGLVILGEWPDLDRVATAAALHRILSALADDANEDSSAALRRAAGVISRTSDDVLRSTATELAHDLGKEIAGG